MEKLEKIISNIRLLYYCFVVFFVVSGLYSFYVGLKSPLGELDVTEQHNFGFMIWTLLISILSLVANVWTLVLFIQLLICLGRSIAKKDIFNLKTVKIINRYAVLAFISAILSCFLYYTVYNEPDHFNLLMVSGIQNIIILLIFGQVIRIGNYFQEEYDLTV